MSVPAPAWPVSPQAGHADRDRGAVTVEAALGICSIVAALVLGLAGAGVVIGQLRCTDAAVEAARLVARGERDRVAAMVSEIAPSGASFEVTVRGDEVTTEVRATFPGGLVPGRWLKARASAVMEPEVSAAEQGGAAHEIRSLR